MKKEELRPVISRLIVKYSLGGERRSFPWRAPGRTAYEVLMAEVLLKRTSATAVDRAYRPFLSRLPTIFDVLQISDRELEEIIAPLGLSQQRTKGLKGLSRYIIGHEHGVVPCELDRLLKVPDVGSYSARAVLSFACGIPAAVVDSNVERIYLRIFNNSRPARVTKKIFQDIADYYLPIKRHREYNFGLLDLGSLVCRPVAPKCAECPLKKICDYHVFKAGLAITGAKDSKLRSIRKSKNISLVGLSKCSGVSKRTIISIELGRTRPQATTLNKLALALNADVEDLLE